MPLSLNYNGRYHMFNEFYFVRITIAFKWKVLSLGLKKGSIWCAVNALKIKISNLSDISSNLAPCSGSLWQSTEKGF